MIYVFAPLQQQAVDWARREGLRPRDVRAFGGGSRGYDGTLFRAGDRVVVLGQLDQKVEAWIDRVRRKMPESPEVERLPLDSAAAR